MIIDGVNVIYPEGLISIRQVKYIVAGEIRSFKYNKWELDTVELTLTDDNKRISVKSTEKSPVRRVRRITGYLSNMENFNDSKAAELKGRVAHA